MVKAGCTDRELAQITDILLDNAIKYAGPDAEISLRCTAEGRHVALTVTDDGLGLTSEEIARATTRFWRSGRQRQDGTAGTGLGLAIVEQLLAGRGGRLELGPARPRGLRAVALVPRAVTDAADRGGTTGPSQVRRPSPGRLAADPGATAARRDPRGGTR